MYIIEYTNMCTYQHLSKWPLWDSFSDAFPQHKTDLEVENQGWSLKKKIPLDPKTMKNEGFTPPKYGL